jgi:lytic murein transglycosylase
MQLAAAIQPPPRWRLPATLVCALLAGCAATPPAAVPTPAVAAYPQARAATFEHWVADFRSTARAAGIGDASLQAAFDGVSYLPRVVELDRAQPEFTRPVWAYIDSALASDRVRRGQEMLVRWRAELDAASAHHAVVPAVLVAIWGLESNFGSNVGDIPTIDALATLGFDGRREAWARTQLLAALQILERGDIARDRMVGSWAGAMGQTQFLPTTFLANAEDADGDGRSDIWGSVADVMQSTAKVLARAGWRPGQPWGAEVQLPPGFDLRRADARLRQSVMQWSAEGVLAADGGPLPPLDDAAILLPAGARGPAFLVGPNFRAILGYNNATSYALAVGLLAQALDGGGGVRAPWPRDLQPLTRSQLRELQAALNRLGFDSGAPDGMLGPATQAAIRRYQDSVGLPADGFPDPDLLLRLTSP